MKQHVLERASLYPKKAPALPEYRGKGSENKNTLLSCPRRRKSIRCHVRAGGNPWISLALKLILYFNYFNAAP
jgi:hypothetical protein